MRNCTITAILVVAVLLSGCAKPLSSSRTTAPALAHNVYFTLHDHSPAARVELVEACYNYLRDHPGVTFFAAGQIVESHSRDVNVRDWNVSLHIVFQTKEDHDRYQTADSHHQFIEENRQNWKTVRVFDTYIE